MKFTKEFKELIEKILKENEASAIEIFLEEAEDQSVAINIGLLSEDEAIGRTKMVDGVPVVIDEETENAIGDATFSAKDDEVTIELEHCCCEEDDGECHHHHHENECCCDDDDCCCKEDK